MDRNTAIPNLLGYISMKSHLRLEELGEILSQKIFAGIRFGGKEKSIHEEIPAIYIERPFMGMLIILDGYSGLDEQSWFTIHIQTWGDFSRYLHSEKISNNIVRVDWYLYYLLKEGLREYSDILIIEPQSPS